MICRYLKSNGKSGSQIGVIICKSVSNKAGNTLQKNKTIFNEKSVCVFVSTYTLIATHVYNSKIYFQSSLNVFEYCQYLGMELNCSEIFTPILTEEGICYSYNILDKEDIFSDFVE